jgi:hypothetical protein
MEFSFAIGLWSRRAVLSLAGSSGNSALALKNWQNEQQRQLKVTD